MSKLQLPEVTSIIIDCLDSDRALRVLEHNMSLCDFAESKLLTSMPTRSKYMVPIPYIGSSAAYSDFCLRSLHRYFDTSHVLISQHDGWVEFPKYWDPEFLKYDYIGSPMVWAPELMAERAEQGTGHGGNGGFSLRSRRLMARISQMSRDLSGDEDVVISVGIYDQLIREGFKFPPLELAMVFSHQGNINDTKPRPTFGFHNCFRGPPPVALS